jgi:predicted ATPase
VVPRQPNLFILSGGPGAGKTTTLAELEKLGFACAPEVARHIIQQQVPKAMPQDRAQFIPAALSMS